MKELFIVENIENIKDTLSYDEDMQKYVLGGKDYEIISENIFDDMKDRIKNSPQVKGMETVNIVKLIIFKDMTKLKTGNQYIKYNTINILIYVPTQLHEEDYRVYRIEDRIENLLRDVDLKGVSELDYVDGRFLSSTLPQYTLYRMTFIIKEGNVNAKY